MYKCIYKLHFSPGQDLQLLYLGSRELVEEGLTVLEPTYSTTQPHCQSQPLTSPSWYLSLISINITLASISTMFAELVLFLIKNINLVHICRDAEGEASPRAVPPVVWTPKVVLSEPWVKSHFLNIISNLIWFIARPVVGSV